MIDDDSPLEELAARLDASGDYKTLRRFVPPRVYYDHDDDAKLTAAAIDLETTGLEATTDAIIQLSLVPFTYSPGSGRIYEVSEAVTFFEDSQRPISAEVTELTGITDADVAGKRIDDDAVLRVLGTTSLVVAHNAGFDRPFAERRIAAFREKPWACSMKDVPWKPSGMASSALEYLLIKQCGRFYDAHRADNDSLALIHLLATPFPDGSLPMQMLLASARRRSARIWAEGAAFEVKDLLKARGCRWNPGNDGRPKAWYREVPVEDRDGELEWLFANVFGGRRPSLRIDTFDARARYSDRS